MYSCMTASASRLADDRGAYMGGNVAERTFERFWWEEFPARRGERTSTTPRGRPRRTRTPLETTSAGCPRSVRLIRDDVCSRRLEAFQIRTTSGVGSRPPRTAHNLTLS